MAEKTTTKEHETKVAQAPNKAAEAAKETALRTPPSAVSAADLAKLGDAPKPRGILQELRDVQRVQDGHTLGSQQTATFGAWCRAKGVTAQDLALRVKEGRAHLPADAGTDGDGPVMTEQDFEKAVDFKYRNTFGEVTSPIKVVAHSDPSLANALEKEREEREERKV